MGDTSYIDLYNRDYFSGGVGYPDYEKCRGVINDLCAIVQALCTPRSVLDVGAAYGFIVDYFRARGVDAVGVEPSDYARSRGLPQNREHLLAGALPDLPVDRQFDVVTCSESLEHIPPEIAEASVNALTAASSRLVVCLIMLEGFPGHDAAGHICLRSRAWWEDLFDKTGFVARRDLESILDRHPRCVEMNWSGRFYVRERT